MLNIPKLKYTDQESGKKYFNQGYRFVKSIQYGDSFLYTEQPYANWGSGVYELLPDGSIGQCLQWNFDSSG